MVSFVLHILYLNLKKKYSSFRVKPGFKGWEEEMGKFMALTVMIVSQVSTYLQAPQVIYIKYL